MAKKNIITTASKLKPANNTALAAVADTPIKTDFQHPMLEQARAQVQAGQVQSAIDTLETLAKQVPPFEQAQLLAYAATFARETDAKRSLALALAATEAGPTLPQAWLALSSALDAKQDRKGAIKAGLKLLELKASPLQLLEVARQLSRLGEDRAALQAATRGYAESGEALELASFTLRVALQCADWALANRITARLAAEHAAGRTVQAAETPRTHLLWCADEATNIKVITAFAVKSFAVKPPMVTAPWPRDKKRKLRIAYISSDYRDHATSLLALGMMRHHDREQFQIYAYCTSHDDNSALRREMLSRFDLARSLHNRNDQQAAAQIVADKIDVLIDLNGLTEGTRHGILAWHPAPVQISWLGFPGTCGGRFVEYIIGDEYTVPKGAEALYPEHVIRMPPTYQINDYAARWLPPPPRRQSLNLPQGVPVIGMFNNVNKVGSVVWATWMQIMRAAPSAVLWMLDPGEVAQAFLLAASELAGVATARIIFAPKVRQEAHLARLQHCDLVLDPWPYGGHTTTGDAIFAGLPVVVLQGTNFASRVSGGLLRAAGLETLVKPDIAAYVQIATALLNTPAELAKLKQFILQRKAKMPLFDAQMRTRQLEAAYLAVDSLVAAGKPAQHLHVQLKRDGKKNEAAA